MGRRRKRGQRKGHKGPKSFGGDPYSAVFARMRNGNKIDLVTPLDPKTLTQPGQSPNLHLWQSDRHQKLIEYHRITVKEMKVSGYLLSLYFEGNEFIFVEVDSYRGFRRYSQSYSSRELAFISYHSERGISWKLKEPIAPT